MATTEMAELPELAEQFRTYGFEWMMREPRQYSEVLVREFYVAYKGKYMGQYPQKMLWMGGNPITFLIIY